MVNDADTLFYVMLSKRYLSRYVLTYDILPLECCHDVNGEKVFDAETLKAMLGQNKVSDSDTVIGLNEFNVGLFQSVTNIKKIGFTSKDSLESFTDKNFQNYELSDSDLYVLENPHESKLVTIEITPPEAIDRYSFSQKVALNDAITIAAQKAIITHPQCGDEILKLKGDAEGVLNRIMSLYTDDATHLAIAVIFFKICSNFDIDNGWQQDEIIYVFKKELEYNPDAQHAVNVWAETARKLINNEDVPLSYTDDSNIILRAMTLVFLNPEQKNIDSMKSQLGEKLGEKVYALADLFISARTGYSYLSAEQRKQINCKAQLHDLSASLYNPVLGASEQQSDTSPVEEKTADTEYSLEQETCLANCSENTFKVGGVKPMAGFDLTLEYKPDSTLAWRIIDAHSGKGMEKLKGQLAINLLSIQKDFPEGARIELVEDKGLYIMLPLQWAASADFKDKIGTILGLLISIKVAQKSSCLEKQLQLLGNQ